MDPLYLALDHLEHCIHFCDPNSAKASANWSKFSRGHENDESWSVALAGAAGHVQPGTETVSEAPHSHPGG